MIEVVKPNLMNRFVEQFNFTVFLFLCKRLTQNFKIKSSSEIMVMSNDREQSFASCLNPNSSIKIEYVNDDGKDFLIREGDITSFCELKTAKNIVNKKGNLGSKNKIKMHNYRSNVDFNDFMNNINTKMASDFYVFVDTSSDVIFYISKLDMTSDTENWVSGGDGVYYKLTNSNPNLHRIDVKLPSEMKKILDSEEKSLYQTLREEERRVLDLEAQRARNLYEAISTQDLS